MEAIAKARYVRMSPRKMRQVVDLIRGKGVDDAINVLHFSGKRAATPVEKTLRSAVANAMSSEEHGKLDPHSLYIKEVRVDMGPSLKRFKAGAMGRPMRIRKPTCHLTLVVTDIN
ncbi:MAG: 50S ribosomal protein L22 [Calditrichaeota bacterium]|nr:MAG: 50S ribosomal protein L22 [Calditrichota bacterium]